MSLKFLLASLTLGFLLLTTGCQSCSSPTFSTPFSGGNDAASAKIEHCKAHPYTYDSYLLGGTAASTVPIQDLDRHFNAAFYNMAAPGKTMAQIEQDALDLLHRPKIKHLVLCLSLGDGSLTFRPSSPSWVSPSCSSQKTPFSFSHALACFDQQTGSLNTPQANAEPIGAIDPYLASHPWMTDPVSWKLPQGQTLVRSIDSLTRIRDLCEEKDVSLTLLCAPVSLSQAGEIPRDQTELLYSLLTQVTPFWDFTASSLSFDSRYFSHPHQPRSCVHRMALARLFQDSSLYVPEDFGRYVVSDNVTAHLDHLQTVTPAPVQHYTANLPVLMYHHLDPNVTPGDAMTISPQQLDQQLTALKKAGYTAVTPDDLCAYVYQGKPLPSKPVVLTFDDGYESNYRYAWPLLKQHQMHATFFMIGATAGNTMYYKNTLFPITPHFSYAQGREMVESGVVSLQSHTYDMHQWAPYEEPLLARDSVYPLPGESREAYRAAFSRDCEKSITTITQSTGEARVHVFAFPKGIYHPLAQQILLEHGFDVTFCTLPRSNTLVKGLPQSLLCLNRFTITQDTTPERLLALLSSEGIT